MKGTGKIWIFYDAIAKRRTKPLSTLQAQVMVLNLKARESNRFFLWTPGWTEWTPLRQFLESDQTVFVTAPTAEPPPIPHVPVFDEDKTVKMDIDPHAPLFAAEDEDGDSVYTQILESEAPGKNSEYGYFHDDFNAEKIDPDAKAPMQFNLPSKANSNDPKDRRSAERHQFKIEVILITKTGRAFRTFSRNISLGGTLLEDEIPKEFVNSQFDLILVNKFEKDPLKGRLHFQGRVVGDYRDPRRLMFLDSDEHHIKRLKALLRSYSDRRKELRKRSV